MKYLIILLALSTLCSRGYSQDEKSYIIEPVLIGGIDSLYKAIEEETTQLMLIAVYREKYTCPIGSWKMAASIM